MVQERLFGSGLPIRSSFIIVRMENLHSHACRIVQTKALPVPALDAPFLFV